jgi:long-chain fatty acid transport protein
MRKFRAAALAGAALFACAASAFGNGLNLNSLGTRAMSLGGAFVGLADDFTSVFWNPAGLAGIRTATFGVAGADIIPSGTYNLTVPPPYGPGTMVDTRTLTRHYLGGIAAYVHPIGPDLVAAVGVYTPSGLGVAWDGARMAALSGGRTDIEWTSRIGLVTIAPTLAYRAGDTFSIGASLNLNYGVFETSLYGGTQDLTPLGLAYPAFDLGQYQDSETGWGVGATLGIRFRPNPRLSFGAVLRTASTVKFRGSATIANLALLGANSASDMRRDVTWPMWIAAGAAVVPMDGLTLTADLQWTQWSKLRSIATTYVDATWEALMTADGRSVLPMAWQDALQIRFGAEYRMRSGFVLRAGFYVDPSAAPDNTMNILLPNFDFKGMTLGAGYNLGSLTLDFGLEYLAGAQSSINPALVATDPAYASAVPGVYKMNILTPSLAVSYRFD